MKSKTDESIIKKKCRKCFSIKPLNEFYKHPQMIDGRINICVECTKKRIRDNYSELCKDPKYIEKERKRGREKYHRLGYKCNANKSRTRENSNKSRIVFPEKYNAHKKSQRIKSPKGKQKHHWSYAEGFEKDVIFLTISEHSKLHRYSIYDQERMMYRRTFDGILIDSREKCIIFIDYLKDLD